MIKVEFDSQSVQDALQKLQRRGQSLKPLLEDIGEYLIISTRQRFHDKEAPDGTPWADNSPLTESLKGSNDPLIGESKSLSRYFSYNASSDTLEFGSPMEYAAVQHFGARQGAFGVSNRGTPLPWGDIPARPILGLSSDDEREVLDIVRDYLSSL